MEKKKDRDKAHLIHLEVNQRIEIVLRAVASVSRVVCWMGNGVCFVHHHEMMGLVLLLWLLLCRYGKSGALNCMLC